MLIVIAYILVVMIWTTTPLAIVWSGETDWFYGVAARIAIGAIFILPLLAFFSTRPFSFKWRALRVYFYAALPILGGMTTMYWAAQYMSSGWVAIMFALTPVVTGVFAYLLLPDCQLGPRHLIAVFVSVIGLVVVFVPNLETQLVTIQIVAIMMAFISVCFHALGTVMVKRCGTQLPALHVAIGALWVTVIGHFLIAPQTLFTVPDLMPREMYAIGYAAIVGSVIGFVLYFYLVRHVSAMKVALIPVIPPVFALLIGHYLNNEELTVTTWIGTGLVVSGLLLFEWRSKPNEESVSS